MRVTGVKREERVGGGFESDGYWAIGLALGWK